jgi:hypothetical protein
VHSTKILRWLLNQLVQDVPAEIVACECICRKSQCTDFTACQRRLDCAAALASKSQQVEAI